mmetsp:Transcript_28990/g.88591  ORF Transcript_28990/g.88591 Transcript_28990/m.88591 type:complete len:309 (-) Transcript_28990:82-1008(-)
MKKQRSEERDRRAQKDRCSRDVALAHEVEVEAPGPRRVPRHGDGNVDVPVRPQDVPGRSGGVGQPERHLRRALGFDRLRIGCRGRRVEVHHAAGHAHLVRGARLTLEPNDDVSARLCDVADAVPDFFKGVAVVPARVAERDFHPNLRPRRVFGERSEGLGFRRPLHVAGDVGREIATGEVPADAGEWRAVVHPGDATTRTKELIETRGNSELNFRLAAALHGLPRQPSHTFHDTSLTHQRRMLALQKLAQFSQVLFWDVDVVCAAPLLDLAQVAHHKLLQLLHVRLLPGVEDNVFSLHRHRAAQPLER